MNPEQVSQLNNEVQAWNGPTFSQIRSNYMQMIRSPKRTGDGFDSLKTRFGYAFGEVDKISYSINRYLVFVRRGTGRGRPLGSDKMIAPKEFILPAVEGRMSELADIVAAIKGDAATVGVRLK